MLKALHKSHRLTVLTSFLCTILIFAFFPSDNVVVGKRMGEETINDLINNVEMMSDDYSLHYRPPLNDDASDTPIIHFPVLAEDESNDPAPVSDDDTPVDDDVDAVDDPAQLPEDDEANDDAPADAAPDPADDPEPSPDDNSSGLPAEVAPASDDSTLQASSSSVVSNNVNSGQKVNKPKPLSANTKVDGGPSGVRVKVPSTSDDAVSSIMRTGLISLSGQVYGAGSHNLEYAKEAMKITSSVSSYVSKISSENDYEDSLHVSASLAGSYGPMFSLSAAVSVARDVKISKRSTTWLRNLFVIYDVEYDTEQVTPESIDTLAKHLVDLQDAKKFVLLYGKYFASGYRSSCSLAAKMFVQCSSMSSMNSFSVNAELGVKAGAFSLDAAVSVQSSTSQKNSDCETSFSINCDVSMEQGSSVINVPGCFSNNMSLVEPAMEDMRQSCKPENSRLLATFWEPWTRFPAIMDILENDHENRIANKDALMNGDGQVDFANSVAIMTYLGRLRSMKFTLQNYCLGPKLEKLCFNQYMVFGRLYRRNDKNWNNVESLLEDINLAITNIGVHMDNDHRDLFSQWRSLPTDDDVTFARQQVTTLGERFLSGYSGGPSWIMHVLEDSRHNILGTWRQQGYLKFTNLAESVFESSYVSDSGLAKIDFQGDFTPLIQCQNKSLSLFTNPIPYDATNYTVRVGQCTFFFSSSAEWPVCEHNSLESCPPTFSPEEFVTWSTGDEKDERTVKSTNDGRTNMLLSQTPLDCDDNPIASFQGNPQMYRYSCISKDYFVPLQHIDGSSGLDDNGGGSISALSRHNIDCGINGLITKSQLSNVDPGKIQFNYGCMISALPLRCHDYSTPPSPIRGGDSNALDKQSVMCKPREALSQFQLRLNGSDNFQYMYRCCSDLFPRQQSMLIFKGGRDDSICTETDTIRCTSSYVSNIWRSWNWYCVDNICFFRGQRHGKWCSVNYQGFITCNSGIGVEVHAAFLITPKDNKKFTMQSLKTKKYCEVDTEGKIVCLSTAPTPFSEFTVVQGNLPIPDAFSKLSTCNENLYSPYPEECLQEWWKDSGCTTAATQDSMGIWNTKDAVKDVLDDMATWGYTSVDYKVRECYGNNSLLAKASSAAKYYYNPQQWKTDDGSLSVRFKASCKNDIHISLRSADSNLVLGENVVTPHTLGYEIVAGGWANTRSVMRYELKGGLFEQPTEITVSERTGICSGKLSSYWFKFDASTQKLSFGTGNEIGKNLLMYTTNWGSHTYRIKYFGFAAWNTDIIYSNVEVL